MKYLSILIFSISILGCSSGDGSGPLAPEPAVLVFPNNNEECNLGISVSDSQSKVIFKWNFAKNTTSYELNIKNLDTDTRLDPYLVTKNEMEVVLDKNTPYSWYVVSLNNESNETAFSETWRFYNSGEAVESHPPFPAEIIAPAMGSSVTGTSVSLEWKGFDLDNDIIGYEVVFDQTSPPTAVIGQTDATEQTITAPISPGNIYYWKIITLDSAENISKSPIFEFRSE